MRFLVDESTGSAVVDFLNSQGHDAVAVALSMPQADDSVILLKAAAEKLVVITNDKDFGELVFRSRQSHAGVLLLRLRDESAVSRVAVVRTVLASHADELAGNFVTATESHIRIRRPPEAPPSTVS